ncbi:MAG: ABC transporter ATP-binding protein/permease [Clostridia bacterium]|nr:ABC transporter ATP-binding protein/permease [Clostridia bacterium]
MPGPMGGGMRGATPQLQKGEFGKNMGKLLSYMRRYAAPLTISIIFTAATTVLAILAPQYLSKLTDELTAPIATVDARAIDFTQLWNFAIILIVFYVCEALFRYVSSFTMTTVSQNMCKRMRTDISVKINVLPLRYFDGHAFGDTLSRVTNDVDTIGTSVNQSFTMLVQSILQIVGVLIAMFVTCWQMALASLIALPIMAILLVVIMRFSQPQFRKQQAELANLDGIVEEDYSGHLVIKAFNAEDKSQRDLDKTNKKLKRATFMSQAISGVMMPVMSVVSYLAYAAVLVVGGILISNGTQTYGVIAAFLAYVSLFQSPLTQIAQAFNSLQSAAAAAGRVFEILEEPELEDESYKERKLTEGVKGYVDFKNVCFGYNEDRIIIPDFSAHVEPGMKVAIVGPTGAGKTTMVNLLMRFYETNSGDIFIDGVSIKDMKREEVAELFGMVLQDTWMFEGTLRDNLVYNKTDVKDETIMEACEAANLGHYVSTLPGGLDYYIEETDEISGGQKQLITIARAMIENAPMLILDEATSNVDTRTEEIIQEAMDRLTEGRTSFVIAHRLSTIRNANLILVMRDGNIVEQGTHEELMELGGFYSELYNSQFASEGENLIT